MPMTAAERQKKYIEKLKQQNPDKKENVAKAKQANSAYNQSIEENTLKDNIELRKQNTVLKNKTIDNFKRQKLIINDEQVNDDGEYKSQQQNEATPLTKANIFVDATVSSILELDKKKLFELNVLSDSLKTVYSRTNTIKTKNPLKAIVDNAITNKYKIKNKMLATAGKQETKSKKKQKEQKRHLLNSMLNLHKNLRCQSSGDSATAANKQVEMFNL
ncbi:unnamed protein product, partial [Brenthis ino]